MADGGPAAPPQWGTAWASALQDLEMDVTAAEDLLLSLHAGQDLPPAEQVLAARWTAPTGLGPLPLPLLERARALVGRQQHVALQLAEATHVNRRHARVAGAVRDRAPAVPVYLDVAL